MSSLPPVESFPRSSRMLMEGWTPDATPAGLTVTRHGNTVSTTGRNKEYGIAIVMAVVLGLVWALTAGWVYGTVPIWIVFQVAHVAFTLAMLLGIVFLVAGKYTLSINESGLEWRRTFLGISWRKGIRWRHVKRLSLTRLKEMVGNYYGEGADEPRRSTILPKIRIDTRDTRWEFGGWLPDGHRLYFRNLIEWGFRQWQKGNHPNGGTSSQD